MSMRVPAARTIASRTRRVSRGEYDGMKDTTTTMAIESAKPLLTLALSQGSAHHSEIDPFFLLLSPRPTRRYFPNRHLTRCAFRAIILATSYSLILAASYSPTLPASYPLSFSPPAPSLTSYSSRCIVQLPAGCHSESCANHVTKLTIILAVSYLQSYLPHPTCYRPRHRHPH